MFRLQLQAIIRPIKISICTVKKNTILCCIKEGFKLGSDCAPLGSVRKLEGQTATQKMGAI
jgi:hypothetical protein